MVWWWGEGKTYFEVLARVFLGEASAGMTHYPNGQSLLKIKKKKKTKGTQEPISRKTNGHDKALGERVNNRPKEAQQD